MVVVDKAAAAISLLLVSFEVHKELPPPDLTRAGDEPTRSLRWLAWHENKAC